MYTLRSLLTRALSRTSPLIRSNELSASTIQQQSHPYSLMAKRIMGRRPRPQMTKSVRKPTPRLIALVTKDNLPYLVKRTAIAKWLPVYKDIKNQTGIWTVIRRIEGDVNALANDLTSFIPSHRVHVKEVARHVRIKGDYIKEVKDWLTARQF
ncbi:hypothetical protein SmJEL517_g00150 [Synchytrium microbalum]|uniref:Large ribosomal subunit protein mL49 n=1 Tax=Synchytrium microbalum TaxID=1806994 RepID=A0A507CK37_9FUNG|nr:uncharacterized protein SmJEL517_g00150 [Synchytrium microbalum]TPX38163.1 hypothetical protein SmJEL517_g00150 [Synchytrium microbalum]